MIKNRKYHGNAYRQGIGNENYRNQYNERREQMTQEERNAENEEERKLTENLKSQAPTAKYVSNYRKNVLKTLKKNGKLLPNNN